MRVLVLVEDYPKNDSRSLMYVHVRNKYYQSNNVDVTVLSFSADSTYIYDGIKVITLNDYLKQDDFYDKLVLHAANIRHHYVFLKKYGKKFKHFIFFYHGHEVLKINKVYSKPYKYIHQNVVKSTLQNVYDDIKLLLWRVYIPTIAKKSFFIFVSKWMEDEFYKWTKIPRSELIGRSMITYNCVSKVFEEETFDPTIEKEFDFITIRGNLDGSKYCVDIVNKLANNSQGMRFLLIGKGQFFDYNKKSDNITWLNCTLSHDEMIEYLQKARFALMPTRTDAQGLMMCEMAAFGIPVITSDIPVCKEVFGDFENAYFINNDNEMDLIKFRDMASCCNKDTRFYMNNTICREIDVINRKEF